MTKNILEDLGFKVSFLGIKNQILSFRSDDESYTVRVFKIGEPESLAAKQREVIGRSGFVIRLQENDKTTLSDYFPPSSEDEIRAAAMTYMIYGNSLTKPNREMDNNHVATLMKKYKIDNSVMNYDLQELFEIALEKMSSGFKSTHDILDRRVKVQKDTQEQPEEYAAQIGAFPKIGNLM